MVTGWLQSSDFTSEDLGSLSADQAIDYFKNHDWASEIEQEEKLGWEGHESCPAGLGLNSDGQLLHICPETEDRNTLFFHYKEPKKILGFIPSSSQVSLQASGVSDEKCLTLIGLFFSGDYDELKREIA
jgi:hypothetical protein